MNGKHGGPQERPQEHAPEEAGSTPAPAPSRTRPDSPRGNKAPRQAAHRSSPPAKSAQLPETTEKDFQAQVIALAQLCGWRVAHFRPARTKDGSWRTPVAADGAGFFDLVLMRERVIFCELKTNRGTLTREQHAWREAATMAKAITVVWRPRDWDLIETVLSKRGAKLHD